MKQSCQLACETSHPNYICAQINFRDLEPEVITEQVIEEQAHLDNRFSKVLARPEIFGREAHLCDDATEPTTRDRHRQQR